MITPVNMLMMVFMPLAINAVGMNDVLGAAWMGGTIDSTGAVVVEPQYDFAAGFAFFPQSCEPNALTLADAGRNLDHQLFGPAAQIVCIGSPLQGLLRSQIKIFINIGTIFGELDPADFLQHKTH